MEQTKPLPLPRILAIASLMLKWMGSLWERSVPIPSRNVTANHTLDASFSAIPSYTLTITKAGTGSGTVTNNPTGTTFNAGTVVTLTADTRCELNLCRVVWRMFRDLLDLHGHHECKYLCHGHIYT